MGWTLRGKFAIMGGAMVCLNPPVASSVAGYLTYGNCSTMTSTMSDKKLEVVLTVSKIYVL